MRISLLAAGFLGSALICSPPALGQGATGGPTLGPTRVQRRAAVTPAPHDDVGLLDLSAGYAILLLGQGPGHGERRFHFDSSTLAFNPQLALAGDWNGDGLDTLGEYESALGEFQLASLNATGDPELVFPFGNLAVRPLAGDFDGDGTDTVGTWDPVSGRFQVRNSNSAGPADLDFVFGPFAPTPSGEAPGPVPLAGDWNGDGTDTIGVYDPSTGTFHLRDSNTSGPPDVEFALSPAGAPLAGDWDGDGRDTVGVLSEASASFELRNTNAAGPPDLTIPLPSAALPWQPLAGHWSTAGTLNEHTGFPWPVSSPAAQGMNGELLAAAVAQAASVPAFHSLLVARHGVLVTEAWFHDWDASMGNCIKSVSKSMLSALYGMAWQQGAIPGVSSTLESLAPGYFPDPDPLKASITVENMLTMTSGLPWPTNDDLSAMVAAPDWVSYVLGQPMASTPGSVFLYSTGLTHSASAILSLATGTGTWDFARANLFAPLGIEATRWDHDPQGIDFGGAEVYMRPRDMARFGQLYLDGGMAGGVQLIPPSWHQVSTSALVNTGSYDYGYWWWRSSFGGQPAYFAWGFGGQFIFVFEGLDMVVVATSSWGVTQSEANAQYTEVFDLLNNFVVPAAGD